MAPQIVLISGCSSDIGLAVAVLLAKDAEKRFKLYATMRNLGKERKTGGRSEGSTWRYFDYQTVGRVQ